MKFLRAIVSIFAFTAFSAAFAQQPVAPPPQPTADGPSLEVTMKFIQARLQEYSKINFAAYTHDNADGNDYVDQVGIEYSNIVADPVTCQVSYHRTWVDNGKLQALDSIINLREVLDLKIITADMVFAQLQAEDGHPARNSRVEPPVFVLLVDKVGNQKNRIWFSDEEMADRIAKALTHAVELCGGGNKEPF